MRKVKIISSPVTERVVNENSTGEIDQSGKHIRVGGVWFNFDDRWKVEDLIEEQPPQQQSSRDHGNN